MFNQFDESVPVTLMGGETGETIWDIFYRRTEFWLVAVLFGGLYFWIMDRYVTGDDWWNAIVHIAAGMMTMIAVVFVSSFLLTRRQMLLDNGRMPFFERFERHISWRGVSAALWMLYAVSVWVFPLWAPHDNHQKILTTAEAPATWLWVVAGVLLMAYAMVITRPTTCRNKIIRMTTLFASIASLWWANLGVMYSSDDSPVLSDWATWIVLVMPLVVLAWYMFDCFRRTKR